MQHDLRVKALIIGLTSPATAENFPDHHEFLYEQLGTPGDYVAEIGCKLAAHDAFPDAAIFQNPEVMRVIEDFRSIVATSEEFQAGTSLESLDLALSRFAMVGTGADLAEVVRLVKNRDGSTAAIVTSSEALEVLTDAAAAHPELIPMLAKLGLDLANPASGAFPRNSAVPGGAKGRTSVADRRAAAVAHRRGIPARAAVRPPARPPVASMAPALERAIPETPASLECGCRKGQGGQCARSLVGLPCDFPTMVQLDGVGADPDRDLTAAMDGDAIGLILDDGGIFRRLSIRNAMRLADSIVQNVRTMLLPGDGYAWVDNLTSPQDSSILVFQNAGVDPAPHASELLEFPHPDGGLVQADVERVGETFTARVYGFGSDAAGFLAGEGLPDMARAKFAAASAVREFINQQ